MDLEALKRELSNFSYADLYLNEWRPPEKVCRRCGNYMAQHIHDNGVVRWFCMCGLEQFEQSPAPSSED